MTLGVSAAWFSMMVVGGVQRKRDRNIDRVFFIRCAQPRRGMAQAVIKIPHGCNRAERRKGKGARNEESLAPIIA